MKPGTRDSLIYLAVGLGAVMMLVAYIFGAERMFGRILEIPGPILWGIISTPIGLGLILERYWEQRRTFTVWAACVLVAAVNLSLMAAAYVYRLDFPALVWSTATVVWVTVVLLATERFLPRDGKAGRR